MKKNKQNTRKKIISEIQIIDDIIMDNISKRNYEKICELYMSVLEKYNISKFHKKLFNNTTFIDKIHQYMISENWTYGFTNNIPDKYELMNVVLELTINSLERGGMVKTGGFGVSFNLEELIVNFYKKSDLNGLMYHKEIKKRDFRLDKLERIIGDE